MPVLAPGWMRGALAEWILAIGLLLVCVLGAGLADSAPRQPGPALQIVAMPDAHGVMARLHDDGRALMLTGRPGEVTARIDFALLPQRSGDDRWVLWMGRVPAMSLQLRSGTWISTMRSFYKPAEDAGPLPIGYAFLLPASWQGPQSVELRVTSDVVGSLRPELISESEARRRERSGLIISAMIYASLLTLALLSLALMSAARDRLFLAFFGYSIAALAMMTALNGHIYSVPGAALLSRWHAFGPMALLFLFSAALPQMLLQYAGTRAHRADAARALDVMSALLILLAALCLLNSPALLSGLRSALSLCWVAASFSAILVVIGAARRGVPMAWPQAVLMVLVLFTGVAADRTFRGDAPDLPWSRYGYQIALAVSVAVLAVGLISRISEYRDQRDRERLARTDSERRMRREAARSDLNAALQTQLRSCAANDVVWTAFRMMLDHLLPHVRAQAASVIAQGYHGQNVLVAMPVDRRNAMEAVLVERHLSLKRQAANGIALQQPVVGDSDVTRASMEALIPLQIRAPAWGMLLLQRAGGEGFSTDELALAGECARLTLTHIDQALTAITLRRSAELDALTGLFNRSTIDQWLQRTFADAQRDGQPVSVLFVDMDHFKAINDRYGHAGGDHCLRCVATMLRDTLAEGDLVGRYGGEEFIVILPGRGAAAARRIGDALRLAVEQLAVVFDQQSLALTVSVGVATRLDGETRPADTIDRADKALYAAKRGGRNCVHVAPATFG